MRVPEEVGAGKVKVTISFASWKQGNVADGTYDVEVEDRSTDEK